MATLTLPRAQSLGALKPILSEDCFPVFPKGRRCAHGSCETILCIYNPGPACYCHSAKAVSGFGGRVTELLFVTDEVRNRYIALMERNGIPREFWGVGGEDTPTHCACGRRWGWHAAGRWSPTGCGPCDKFRPLCFGPNEDPETAQPGQWDDGR
jgi:hypothetical protein